MQKFAIATCALMAIGMLLVATIVADSAGATLADAEGYAQTVHGSVTPATIIAEEHALFRR